MNDPHDTTASAFSTTWVFSLDRGGNILNKTKYAFTTGALGSVVEDIPYTYGDSNWKDMFKDYHLHWSFDSVPNLSA